MVYTDSHNRQVEIEDIGHSMSKSHDHIKAWSKKANIIINNFVSLDYITSYH